MLLSVARLKQSIARGASYLNHHRRFFLFFFLVLPTLAYLFTWMLCTTEGFFPRPLRNAKEVLLVVAHPDDECNPLS